jgi:hypothetical protein
VVGRWGEDRVLIRLEDGRALEAPAPEPVADFDVDDRVDVYFGSDGELLGWYLPDKKHGVDLRGHADEH